jgi:hypothetical protein
MITNPMIRVSVTGVINLENLFPHVRKLKLLSFKGRIYALKQGFILERVEEDLSFLLVLMEVLGKNKQDLQSKIEVYVFKN